jgi:hypothetical protein
VHHPLQQHRTDRLSAAVKADLDPEMFTRRYPTLLAHYGPGARAIQPRQAPENGDVERSPHGFKQAVDQALMVRGSREFATRGASEAFLREVMAGRNANRRERFAEEQAALASRPARRLEMGQRVKVRVDAGSTIHVGGNAYSVSSRLIGERVEVHVGAERLEVWYAARRVDELPRLRGRGKHPTGYRHVIDWLMRTEDRVVHGRPDRAG